MRRSRQDKGMVMLMVLGTLFIVILLANIIIGIMSSQQRLTRHQVSRTQAYYAAFAGMNYAMDMMRPGRVAPWVAGSDCTQASPCTLTFAAGDFTPANILTGNSVTIIIYAPQASNPANPCYTPPGNSNCIKVTADYAYAP